MTNEPSPHVIPVLNLTVPLPEFSFFQVVKVKTTKEVGTIAGMWCIQTEPQSYQWNYRVDGLRTVGATWWQGEQLQSFHRRRR